MADRNWHQQFITNPASSVQNDDLFYFPRSPYAADGTDDFVINWQNLLASIQSQLPSGMTWVDVTGTSQAMSANVGYVTDNVGLVTLSLPVSSKLGDGVKVVGFNTGGWTVTCGVAQSIHMGNDTTTTSISSMNQYDCVTLRCVVPNAEWIVEASQGNITLA